MVDNITPAGLYDLHHFTAAFSLAGEILMIPNMEIKKAPE